MDAHLTWCQKHWDPGHVSLKIEAFGDQYSFCIISNNTGIILYQHIHVFGAVVLIESRRVCVVFFFPRSFELE